MDCNIDKKSMMYKVTDIYEKSGVVENQTVEESITEVRLSNLWTQI